MRSTVVAIMSLCLLALSAVGSSAAGSARLTRCVATTFTGSGQGTAVFSGTCNGSVTELTANPGSVKGRVGGLSASLAGRGSPYTGRIGGKRMSFSIVGNIVTGRYAASALRFASSGTTLVGRVGSRRVACSITPLARLGERVACSGSGGGAEVLIPLLAEFYAAP
jgi:hypothetical protein